MEVLSKFKRYWEYVAIEKLRALSLIAYSKERQLLLFDPKALYHILIKDQSFYEESDAFLMCV
jgi:hypothetical protein